jgi:hypothetical protein
LTLKPGIDTPAATGDHRHVTRHEREAAEPGVEETARPVATPTPEAVPSTTGPLDATGVMALQRGAGNAAVARHLVARQTPTTTPPAPAAFVWADAGLKLGVEDDTFTAESIFRYVMGKPAADQAAAFEELERARTDMRTKRVTPLRVQKIDEVLQKRGRDIALAQAPGTTAPVGGWRPGTAPAALTAGTHAPTAAEQDQLRDAMAPPRRTTSSGALAPFHSKIPSETMGYEERIFRALHARIDALWDSQVKNKGLAEHADPTKLNPWSRYEAVADVAKDETDKVFGAYARGPNMRHGRTVHSGNLRDRFSSEVADQRAIGSGGRARQAEILVEYFLQSSGRIERINTEHDAIPERTTVSPGETKSEAQILRGVVRTLAAARRTELLEIDRGWDATAGGGVVNLQRWKRDTPAEQREHFWDVMQTLIHEYLHTLTHSRYSRHAERMPGGDKGLQFNTLIEGMTSALTEVVWANVESRAAALGPAVEGSDFVDASTTLSAIPPIHNRRYPSYHQAMEMISVIGAQNVYAAYFLGKVDLIKSSPPAP